MIGRTQPECRHCEEAAGRRSNPGAPLDLAMLPDCFTAARLAMTSISGSNKGAAK
jgi:hypothetical protein